MGNIVDVDHLSFAYQEDFFVLKDISFSVEKKEFIGIIGPNGGGKTTLLKLLMGFLKPTSGTIHIFDQNPHDVRNKIAYVPQSLRFDKQFPISVKEVVLLGRLSRLPWHGVYSHDDHQAAREALDRVGLISFSEAPFGTLSSGQAQRVLIARALAGNPEILLLDEPTANVDAQAEADILAILKELTGQLTIFMVTHDLQTAIDQVQRVLCVQNSLMTLSPEEVCQHFAFGLYHKPLISIRKTP